MRDELAELLDEVRADAPPRRYDVDDMVAAGRRLRRRRSAAWAAGAVLAVTAAVAVPQVLIRSSAAPPPVPAAGSATPRPARPIGFDQALRPYQVDGYRVSEPVAVSLAYERAYILRSAPAPLGWVARYRAGYFDPTDFQTGERVEVSGRPGWFRRGEVAWQYADGAWATASLNSGTRAGLLRVAAGLTVGRDRPATFPIRLGRMPDGYRLAEVNSLSDAGQVEKEQPRVWTMWFLPGPLNGRPLRGPVFSALVGDDPDPGQALRVTVRPIGGPYKDNMGAPWCAEATCLLPLTNGYELTATSTRVGLDELREILRAATVADPDRPESWPTVDQAVPVSARFTD